VHTYVLRRLALMIPTLFGITIIVFAVMAAAPGGISAQSLIQGQNLEPAAKKAMEEYYNRLYGLDQPAPVQYLRWLNNISPIGFTFDAGNNIESFSFTKGSDLGTSFYYNRPVLDLIVERLPITLLLNVLSIPIIYVIAITIGVRAATERGKRFDVTSGVVMLALWSVPTMLTGVLMIAFLASDQYWRWFPAAGVSERAALEMPFMPHWSAYTDVILLLLLAIAGAALFVGLSRKANRTVRAGAMAGLGAVLGFMMAAHVVEADLSVLHLILGFSLAGLFALIGRADYELPRTVTMGLIGLGLGIGVATTLAQGSFVRGFLLDRLWHLVLPVLCLSYGGFAFLSKLTRTAVLENLLADYARTARAKGVKESDVLWRHVFRNSLLPLITVSATLLPGLLAGSVIVESIFSIEGMGKLAVEAVSFRDRELVLSVTLISGLLTLAGYLIADLCYAVADPRVSYE
jgi:ABC-type dipeptide/oligopeptide/nickel transport system permease component